jgi:anthranilate/para-aminobenzoate synthase component II
MRLKDTIKGELAMAIAESKNVRAIGICFWNQILGDILGSAKMYGMDDKEGAHTMPGPLEIGLAGITPTGDGVTHPMFQDCSHPTTNIMSRGGHLRGNGIDEKKSSLLQILARSDASGTAAAWQWDGGRALGLQFHPEICIDEKRRKSRDVQRFLKELSSPLVLPMLQKTFDCDMDDVRDNFDYRQAQIAGDAGKEILVNSILFQLRGLKNDLGGMTTEQPRQAPHTSR